MSRARLGWSWRGPTSHLSQSAPDLPAPAPGRCGAHAAGSGGDTMELLSS